MKHVFLAALFAATTSLAVQAQPQAPAGNAPRPPHEGKMPPPPPGNETQQTATYSGTVAKLVTNNDFVYDGFYLLSGKDSLMVKFPPHMGSQVTAAVKEGATVSVNGAAHTTPSGEKEIRLMSLTANGKTVSDTATFRAPAPPADETTVSGSGKIASLQKDREGRVNGLILSNNTILRLPPDAASQWGTGTQSGSEIAYTGMQKAAHAGEVSSASYKIVHCRSITVNGKQYSL